MPPPQIIEYPDQRSFVAIGLRDDTYAAAMAQAVSAVLRIDIDASTLLTRLSSNGKYLSVHPQSRDGEGD